VNPTTITRPGLALPPMHGINPETGGLRPLAISDSNQVGWRSALESLWACKLDEVIALSKAIQRPAARAHGGFAAHAVPPPRRFRSRMDRACEQLADAPQSRSCPACFLSQAELAADAARNSQAGRVIAMRRAAARPRDRHARQATPKTAAAVV
jgi:hypothetical protein